MSTIRYPHLNLILFFKLCIALIGRLLSKIFNPLFRKIIYLSKKNKILFFLLLTKKGKYLIPIYNQKTYWDEEDFLSDWFSKLPESGWKPTKNSRIAKNNWNFRLSGEEILLGNSPKIEWSKTYADSEDTMSLHRFDWLITLLAFEQSNNLPSQGIDWIEDWIINKEKINKEIGWDSYTVSERIVNWLMFLCAVKPYINEKSNKIPLIESVLYDELKYLAFNLDYWGKDTNNHILNNARALYIGGCLLGVPYAKKIGLAILKNETDQLLPEGVLKEGSTHYQLLITRTFLEILWFSKMSNDINTYNWLKPRLVKMLDCCHLISINYNKIPLVGDISPDYPPNWFFGYPFTYRNNKKILAPWTRIWGDFKNFNFCLLDLGLNNTSEVSISSPINSQWHKYKNNNLLLFSTAMDGDIKSHIHQDKGSLCVYYDNFPILIDPGLMKYTWKDPIVKFQSEVLSHSTISINKIGLIPSKLSQMDLMHKYFSKKNISYHIYEDGIKYMMKGFRALGRWVSWIREINLNNNELIINDFIETKKDEETQISYVFDKNINFNKDISKGNNGSVGFDLSVMGFTNNKSTIINKEIKLDSGYSSEYYGDLSDCKIIKVLFSPKQPITISSRFLFYRINKNHPLH